MIPSTNFKKYLLVIILLNIFGSQAKAQMVLLPDTNFRNALVVAGFGSCITGNYIDSTCSLVTSCINLDVSNKNIHDLTGLGVFKNLQELDCFSNFLTGLPALPTTLSILLCFQNQITSLPALPTYLTVLRCYKNSLSALPALPSSLNYLDCNTNLLTSIPSLPNSLSYLSCYENQISALPYIQNVTKLLCGSNPLYTLPVFPNTLLELSCEADQLSVLPQLPANLQMLFCKDNFLTNLPSLPNTILSINCDSNQLTVLPNLPPSIQILSFSHNLIVTLPQLPASLQNFYGDYNLLTSIPVLPTNTISIRLFHNKLTALPVLPNSVNDLVCDSNELTTLPTLPSSLAHFSCGSNFITTMPSLPDSLHLLRCDNNLLNNMPTLPRKLYNLICNDNQFTTLPEFPDSVYFLYCNNNPNLSCLTKLNKIEYFIFTGTNITCLPNYGTVYISGPLVSSLPLCGFFNPSACSSNWNISGKTYYDANNDCIFNSGDFAEYDFKMQLLKNGNLSQQAYTGGEGFYSFDTDSLATYETKIDTTDIPFIVNCPSTLYYTDTLTATDSLKYNRDFSLKCKSGFDLAAWDIYTHGFLKGQSVVVKVLAGDYSEKFGGHCAAGISGVVHITFTGSVTYVGPALNALTPSSISGTTLTYNVQNFGTIDYDSAFNFVVSVDTIANIGSPVCITVDISPFADNNPNNNRYSACFSVISSFDPNEKEVSPQTNLDVNGDHWLTYTIQFQNTGTAPAENIYLIDTLNSNLDLSTFQLLSYSKEPYVQILPGGIAKFNFPNINLPDSTSDEPHSHGFVQYKIKAKDSLVVGVQIANTAYIYFDYNAPVVTNTVTNTVFNCPQNVQTITANICGGGYNFNGLILTQSGNYSQHFTTPSGCDSIINLSLTLQIDTVVTRNVDTLKSSTVNTSFQWMNCLTGNIISGATSQYYIPSNSGYYSVIVSNGTCTDTSGCHFFIMTGIQENVANLITISPNPSKDEFNISIPSSGNSIVKVFDVFGRLITEKTVTNGTAILKAESWSAGMYLLQITNGENIGVRKIIKN